MSSFSRRSFLALLSLLCIRRGESRPGYALADLKRLTRDAVLHTGRIKLEIPLLADNGHSVAISVSVASPMTELDYVRSIHLFAEKNPRPNIANFFLSPQSGKAEISTRIRLAGTQRVIAVANLSDDSWWSAEQEVVVTASACLDES